MRLSLVLSLVGSFVWSASAHAQEITPDDSLTEAIAALEPGGELILHEGTYTTRSPGGSWYFAPTIAGTAAAPIVIRAADGEHVVIEGDPAGSQNIVNLTASYLTIRGVELTGGSHGIRLQTSDHVTIEDCVIHGTRDVGISANFGDARYEAITIRHNEIYGTGGTGEGMYLGCNGGACELFDSLIEGNWIHDITGVSQGDGIELKPGCWNVVIRGNVIHDIPYPGIFVYGTMGRGEPNVVEQNVIWHSGDNAIQIAADAIVRNNIVLSAAGSGISIQMNMVSPANVTVVNNTVLAPTGTALRVQGVVGPIVIANNALYSAGAALRADGDLSMVTFAGNVVVGSVTGATSGTMPGDLDADFVDASLSGGVPNDPFPTPAGALAGSADSAYVPDFDFNGTARTTDDVGAYQVDAAGNPGWVLASGFREEPTSSGVDGGVDVDAGPGTDGGPGSDAGAAIDAGSSGEDGGVAASGGGGCACSAAGAAGRLPIGLALLGLVLIAVRRRRAHVRD